MPQENQHLQSHEKEKALFIQIGLHFSQDRPCHKVAMAKQSFQNLPLCIIICSSIWWLLLLFCLPTFILDIGGDQFRGVISLTALQMQLQQLALHDGVASMQSNRREDHNHFLAASGDQWASVPEFAEQKSAEKGGAGRAEKVDCNGRYVYMYTLPPKFNKDLLRECRNLSMWTDMCPHIAKSGLGQPLLRELGPETSSWFATNQFTVEVIFHERMKRHSCLTADPSKANAFYVPFYAGLQMSSRVRDKNITARDRTGVDLVRFLRNKPQWKKMWGRDHFMVIGRITWGFLRETDNPGAWGNRLLLLPEVQNMSTLLIEAHPWHANEHGIPYPSYFHPWNKSEVERWQERMRWKKRVILFSFAGAPRPGLDKASIRANIFQQCSASSRCEMLKCEQGPSVCHKPGQVMDLFANSVFCLQPQGDSFTRRSIFDSMLAGCIPVFFTEHTAYTQYKMHLPHNRSSYSVFITEESVKTGNLSIEKHLLSMPESRVESMRREVVRLIPSLLYADPRQPKVEFRDAVDVTIDGLVRKFSEEKEKLGTSPGNSFSAQK